jgi:hypothetical protein
LLQIVVEQRKPDISHREIAGTEHFYRQMQQLGVVGFLAERSGYSQKFRFYHGGAPLDLLPDIAFPLIMA